MDELPGIARIVVPSGYSNDGGWARDIATLAESTWAFARTLWVVAFDDNVRVVLLSDSRRAERQAASEKPSEATSDTARHAAAGVDVALRMSRAVTRAHYAFALMDKPVVGHFVHDVKGPVASLMLAADLVVLAEDVWFQDHGPDDADGADLGAGSLLPLFMTPGRAKEALLTGRRYSAPELADLGVVNHVLPADRTAAKAEELAAALLRRPAYALAATKRLANKSVLHQLNRSLDSGFGHVEELTSSVEASK